MFLPIGDDQDHDRTPRVNRALLAANAAVFVLFCFPEPSARVVGGFALHPDALRPIQFLTHMFLHADVIHVLGNLLFLWIFGRLVEERLGSPGYAALYLLSGLGAAGLQLLAGSRAPMLGSSGAVSGAIGACLVFCPRAHVKVLYWFFFTGGTAFVPVTLWALLWVVEQVFFASRGAGPVAYWAHLGGFAAGYVLAWLIRERAARRLRPREASLEPRAATTRKPFQAPSDDDAVFLDDRLDAYALVWLGDPPEGAPRSGVVARGVSRADADAKRRELGMSIARIADQPANFPPTPRTIDAVSWDDRGLRFRVGAEVTPLSWSLPCLVVEAVLGTDRFLDVFVSRTVAWRVPARPGTALTRVDPLRRQEESATLDVLVKAFEERRSMPCAGGRFEEPSSYADYVFRAWHLARAGRPVHRS